VTKLVERIEMAKKSVKVYELYPVGGGFSSKTIDYRGEIFAVAAVSIKQAYYFAGNRIWAEDATNPKGILWVYNKFNNPDTKYWNGSSGWGLGPRHGAGKREILVWVGEIPKAQ
jgi:hypothetical protein